MPTLPQPNTRHGIVAHASRHLGRRCQVLLPVYDAGNGRWVYKDGKPVRAGRKVFRDRRDASLDVCPLCVAS